MNNKMNNKIFTLIIAIVLIIGGWIFYSGDKANKENNEAITKSVVTESTAQEEKFDQVPAFTLEDWNGNEVTLASFQGKPLILNSWAVWCPFCLNELLDFAELQKELGDSVVIIAIDRSESTEKQKKFTDELEVTDKLLFLNDAKDSFYQSIGGFSMPETLFVDKDGNIRFHKRGPMDINEMRRRTRDIISE